MVKNLDIVHECMFSKREDPCAWGPRPAQGPWKLWDCRCSLMLYKPYILFWKLLLNEVFGKALNKIVVFSRIFHKNFSMLHTNLACAQNFSMLHKILACCTIFLACYCCRDRFWTFMYYQLMPTALITILAQYTSCIFIAWLSIPAHLHIQWLLITSDFQ